MSEFSEFESIQVAIEDAVAHIQMCRPKALNNMNRAFWTELPKAVELIERSGDARAIVLSGQGKHFTAGMDLDVFQSWGPNYQGEPARRGEELRRWVIELQQTFTCLEDVRMPVIAAVQGACIGGGVDMVCACDIRLCSEDAFFSVKETAIGMTADLGTLQRLPKLIAPGLARELVYTARNFPATEACTSGFVNHVYPDQDSMLDAALTMAKEIAGFSPVAIAGCKNMMNYSRDHSTADSLTYMATWQSGMFQLADLMEGVTAQQQKRSPNYEDLLPIAHPMDTPQG